jgi:hypothetical protein
MDGDGRVCPYGSTGGNGMSTREHWDECPSVFDLGRNVRKYDLRLCTIVHIINSDELPMGSQ